MKNIVIIFMLMVLSFTISACGVRRDLTMPESQEEPHIKSELPFL